MINVHIKRKKKEWNLGHDECLDTFQEKKENIPIVSIEK